MSAEGKPEKTGECLCGGVRYRITGPLRPVVYCHCSQCRRTSGHFVAATAVAKDALEVVVDECLEWFASSEFASRGFCRRCGSSLFWLAEGRDHVSIMAGTLDEGSGLEAVQHIYVDDKGDYYDLTDNLPKAPGHARAPESEVTDSWKKLMTARRRFRSWSDLWPIIGVLGFLIAFLLLLIVDAFIDTYSGQNGSLSWRTYWEDLSSDAFYLFLFYVLVFGILLYVKGPGRRWPFGRGPARLDDDP